MNREELKLIKQAEKEQKELFRQAEKEKKRLLKEEQKKELEQQKLLKQAPMPTEEELVHRYVNRVIKNAEYHGRIDQTKFDGFKETEANKNLWLDTDFYFSVVFQSRKQKYEFLTQWQAFIDSFYEEDVDQVRKITIVNGLELAKSMGIQLTEEKRREYPTANIDLLPLILDNEKV